MLINSINKYIGDLLATTAGLIPDATLRMILTAPATFPLSCVARPLFYRDRWPRRGTATVDVPPWRYAAFLLISKEISCCAILGFPHKLIGVTVRILRTIKGGKTMKVATKILALAIITGTLGLTSTGASAWWNDDNDYWGGGPWGHPGYGGWGGYPGYGGWGGYPGYGGWGGYPGYGGWGGYPGYGGWGGHTPRVEIYTQPQGSGSSQGYTIE